MEDININGTKAVMDSVPKAGVGQVLYTSSTTAYGFHPDNDNTLTDVSPLRGNDDFTYSKCKRLVVNDSGLARVRCSLSGRN